MRSVLWWFVLLLVVLPAVAQNPPEPRLSPAVYTYAAKFVCGTAPQPVVVVPGTYMTAVNVHNPSRWETATLRKKFAVGLPGEEVGKISPYIDKQLRADEAMLIECRNIYGHLQLPPAQFIEGYVVIESDRELDVVSVYTAGTGAPNGVTTMHTERVPVRVARPCNPLDKSLRASTAWQVASTPSGPVSTPTNVQMMNHAWIASPLQMATANTTTSAPGGVYEYKLCFCLCTGPAKVNITRLIGDNIAEVFVNGTSLGVVVNSSSTSVFATPAQLAQMNTAANALLRGGENCITVRVTNNSNLTGFFIDGTITGANAACPVQALP